MNYIEVKAYAERKQLERGLAPTDYKMEVKTFRVGCSGGGPVTGFERFNVDRDFVYFINENEFFAPIASETGGVNHTVTSTTDFVSITSEESFELWDGTTFNRRKIHGGLEHTGLIEVRVSSQFTATDEFVLRALVVTRRQI